MKLTINLITRGRPERLLDTLERTVPNISLSETTFMVSMDEDDAETLAVIKRFPKRVKPCVLEREDSIGEKWNRALLEKADVYMPCGDYTPIVTYGFDQKILETASLFPDGIGVVYSHMANGSFPGIWSVTHKFTEKLGYMCPPYFPYWFVDHWIDDVAKLIDRIAFTDIQIDVGKKPKTQELRDLAFWATLFDCGRLIRRGQARKIIESEDFQEPAWRKLLLLTHYPLTEYKSQLINDVCRNSSEAFEKAMGTLPGGPRYDRLKAKAIKLMNEWSPSLLEELDMQRKAA